MFIKIRKAADAGGVSIDADRRRGRLWHPAGLGETGTTTGIYSFEYLRRVAEKKA